MGNKQNDIISESLYRLNVGSDIPIHMLKNAFTRILTSEDVAARDTQMGALLTGVMAKGPTSSEICALLEAAFDLDGFSPYQREKINLPGERKLVSAIGSGKKGVKTMNISTPALITAAAAGSYTAKSVSSSTSSASGSADFLREVGLDLSVSREDMIKTIKKTGFGAFDIEAIIPKFDRVYSGRFYAPHTLSFGLAALTSPVAYDDMLYGLAHPNVELAARVLRNFGIENVMIVSSTSDGIHYIDEMGISGVTQLIGVRDGNIGRLRHFNPTEQLNLPPYTPEDIKEGMTLEENVQYVMDVLRGSGEEAREDVVCINAGNVIYLSGMAEDLFEGYKISKELIKRGKPLEKLQEILEANNGDLSRLKRYLVP